jgi:glucan endo-1,3-alpha-glucosidase
MGKSSTSSSTHFREITSLYLVLQNDGPESHYIGSLWSEQQSDPQAALYSGPSYTHTGWDGPIASFIHAYKNARASSLMFPAGTAVGVGSLWYKPFLTSVSCSGTQPVGYSAALDNLNWAVVLPLNIATGWNVRLYSKGVLLKKIAVTKGLSYGAVSGVKIGAQQLELYNPAGKLVMIANGTTPVASSCPNGVYNLNPVVVGLVTYS